MSARQLGRSLDEDPFGAGDGLVPVEVEDPAPRDPFPGRTAFGADPQGHGRVLGVARRCAGVQRHPVSLPSNHTVVIRRESTPRDRRLSSVLAGSTPPPGRGTTLPFPAPRRHRWLVSISSTLERPPRREAAPSTLRGFGVVVGGIGSRIAMRIAALTAREAARGLTTEAGATIGRITFEGTAFLVVAVGIGSALVGTAFYLASLPWLPRRRSSRALAFGCLELVVFGTVLLDPGNPDFTILGRPLLNVLVLGSLFVLHGVALVMLVEPSGH